MNVCAHTEGFKSHKDYIPASDRFRTGVSPIPPSVDMHDCAYVSARNRLIPSAERDADRKIRADVDAGIIESVTEPAAKTRWSFHFLASMDEMARSAGLVA